MGTKLNMPEFIAGIAVVIGLILAGIYFMRYRRHPWDIYYPKLAWMRAGM